MEAGEARVTRRAAIERKAAAGEKANQNEANDQCLACIFVAACTQFN